MNRSDTEAFNVLERLRLRVDARPDGGIDIRLVMQCSNGDEYEPEIDSRTVYIREGRLVSE